MHTNPDVKIAITMSDDALVILSFITQSRSPTLPSGAVWLADKIGLWYRAPTDENIAAELRKAVPPFDQLGRPKPQPVRWTIVSEQMIPTDRTYRNAWRHDGETFVHDMDHARRIHLDHIRHARTEYLGVLDREWSRAIAKGDTKGAQKIEAKRQALRDAPTTLPVQKATTPAELKALWPEGLPPRLS